MLLCSGGWQLKFVRTPGREYFETKWHYQRFGELRQQIKANQGKRYEMDSAKRDP